MLWAYKSYEGNREKIQRKTGRKKMRRMRRKTDTDNDMNCNDKRLKLGLAQHEKWTAICQSSVFSPSHFFFVGQKALKFILTNNNKNYKQLLK